jgi:uncharacterized membrane protein YfcA
MDGTELTLALTTLIAAAVTGAVGYGFSSLTVPIALLFLSNKILNPALVLVAIVLNGYVLLVNRNGLSNIWKRVLPVLLGLIPGITVGSYILFSANAEWLKLITYVALLPLILLQAAGVRRPIHSERAVGVPLGAGVGVLYSVTTISGPPMALLFNNQGLVKEEFRAAMALLRVVQALVAAVTYYFLGLFSVESSRVMFNLLPSVLIGVPVGAFLIRRIQSETFRRLCMSYDAWIVGYGLSRALLTLQLLVTSVAYGVWAVIILADVYLLSLYFAKKREVEIIASSVEDGAVRRQQNKPQIGNEFS